MTLGYWLDTGSGCGAVFTDERGAIVHTCPYFSRYRGRLLNHVILDLRERGKRVRWAQLSTNGATNA